MKKLLRINHLNTLWNFINGSEKRLEKVKTYKNSIKTEDYTLEMYLKIIIAKDKEVACDCF